MLNEYKLCFFMVYKLILFTKENTATIKKHSYRQRKILINSYFKNFQEVNLVN